VLNSGGGGGGGGAVVANTEEAAQGTAASLPKTIKIVLLCITSRVSYFVMMALTEMAYYVLMCR